MNCIHGIDARFCARCNRTAQSKSAGSADVTLEAILALLNAEEVRATYVAVAEALGVPPRALEARLGTRRPEVSWIVSAENGLPNGYDQSEWHPALLSRAEIITSGRALILQMSIRRAASR
jgi:hypothetical protein